MNPLKLLTSKLIDNKTLYKFVVTAGLINCNIDVSYASIHDQSMILNQQLTINPTSKAIASELFQRAEEAIELTQKSYKQLDKEWLKSKDLFNELITDITSSIQQINKIEKDLIKLEANILNIIELDKTSIKQTNDNIASLRVTVATKYQTAEDATKDPTIKPIAIAKLFDAAQAEAIVLNEEENVNNLLNNIEEELNLASRKSADSVRIIQDTIKQLSIANKEFEKGIQQLITSKEVSSKKLEGVKGFRIGINQVSKALDKYNSIVKGLAKDIRAVQVVSVDLKKLYAALQPLKTTLNKFEKERFSNPNIKVLKNLLNSLDEKVQNVEKLSTSGLDELLAASNSISGKQFKKGQQLSKKDELLEYLRSATNQLEIAEKAGKEAEGLLRQARQQGEKEASIYLKYFQYAKPATVTVPAKR